MFFTIFQKTIILLEKLLYYKSVMSCTWNRLSTGVRCTFILLSELFFTDPPLGKSSSIDAMFDTVLRLKSTIADSRRQNKHN